MKKRFLVALVACAFVVGNASAAVLVSDNFDYPDGSLVPNGGWVSHSGVAGDLQVVSGAVVVQHGAPSEDANLGFAGVSGNVYFGIDFVVTASDTIPGIDTEYFAHFMTAGTFNFAARLDVVAAPGGGDYSVGIASDESTADAIWPTDLVFGVSYRAVVRYDQDNNIAELWIDAAVEGDASILGEDRADPGDPIDAFALRQSDSDLNETVTVDNLCVGSTFADVVAPCTPPVAVEESTWSGVKSLYTGK